MKILIVEDEIKTALYLQKGLVENGFVVDLSHDGEDGLFMATHNEYDLLILDVMLPKMDGWTLVSEIRKSGKQVLTLFLTARDQVTDRVKGLDLGADAYLVKPFSFSELLALIRSLLRRSRTIKSEILKIGDMEIDLFRHHVVRGGKQLDLTPKEFALLALLAQRRGEVISRTVITEQVWGMHFDSDTNIVEVHIRRLRAKVDDPFAQKLIHTVRGIGYVLDETKS